MPSSAGWTRGDDSAPPCQDDYGLEPPAPPSRQLSPDGKYWWDGSKWVPLDVQSAPPPVVQSGSIQRQFSPDGRWWWDGQRWLPYKPITWNSIQLRSNPPEDAAALARNLGIWCIVLGTISLLVGGISILAVIGGVAALVHWNGFRESNSRVGGTLPGSDNATLGLILTVIGFAELIASLALRFVVRG